LQGALISVVIDAGDETELGAVASCGLHFGNGRAVGQADERGNAVFLCGKRDSLRVVSRRAGDDAPLFLFGRKAGDLIICASDLEGPRLLQVFRFETDFAAVGELVGMNDVGGVDRLFENASRVIDFFNGEHILPPAYSAR